MPLEIVNLSVTPAADAAIKAAIKAAGQTVEEFVTRHSQGDWGNLVDENAEFYDCALIAGSTVEGEYVTKDFERVWIYTSIGQYTRVYLPAER